MEESNGNRQDFGPELTETERQLLSEYRRLAKNLSTVSQNLQTPYLCYAET